MKSLRFRIRSSVVLLSAILGSSLFADVVVLKNGDRFEGKILSEDATSLTIEYRPTPNTRDTRTLEKSNILEVVKLTPSEAEFKENKLAEVLPTKDLMTAADYERVIQDRLRSFINRHPNTHEAGLAEELIKELSAEKDRVLNGDLKVNGTWMNAKDVKLNAYDIDAYRLRYSMNIKAQGRDEDRYVQALRDFELLKKQYPASNHYVKAIPEANEILEKYIAQLNGMIAEEPIISQRREAGLKLLTGNDAAKVAVADEISAFKKKAEEEKKDRVQWKTIYKYDAASLKDALAEANKVSLELSNLDIKALAAENEALTAIYVAINDENLEKAKALVAAVDRSTLVNKTILSTVDRSIAELTKVLNEREKKKQQEAVKAQGTGATGEQAVDTATSENAMAEALKQASAKREAEAAAAQAAADEENASQSEKKIAEDKQAGMDKISQYIPYAGVVLVILLILGFVSGKKKK